MAVRKPIESRRRVVAGSNRSFGIVFSCFFALVGLRPLAAKIRLAFRHSDLVCFFSGGLFAPRC